MPIAISDSEACTTLPLLTRRWRRSISKTKGQAEEERRHFELHRSVLATLTAVPQKSELVVKKSVVTLLVEEVVVSLWSKIWMQCAG